MAPSALHRFAGPPYSAPLLTKSNVIPAAFFCASLAEITVGEQPRELPSLREAAAASWPSSGGARGEDLVFVDNTTTGANAVLLWFAFQPDDEVLVSDLGYGVVIVPLSFAAREKARRWARLPCLIRSRRKA